jgi:hypothetical protein
MSEVVELLREGWYGAKAKEGEDNEFKKKACRVDHLFNKAIHMANTKFIKMCDGLDGAIGALEIKDNHQANYKELPIDMLINTIDRTGDYELMMMMKMTGKQISPFKFFSFLMVIL